MALDTGLSWVSIRRGHTAKAACSVVGQPGTTLVWRWKRLRGGRMTTDERGTCQAPRSASSLSLVSFQQHVMALNVSATTSVLGLNHVHCSWMASQHVIFFVHIRLEYNPLSILFHFGVPSL